MVDEPYYLALQDEELKKKAMTTRASREKDSLV